MKPVVIIAIAVVCSVVAVLGVLFALDLYSVFLLNEEIKQITASEKRLNDFIETSVPLAEQCSRDKTAFGKDCLQDIRNELKAILTERGERHLYNQYMEVYPMFCWEHPIVIYNELDCS